MASEIDSKSDGWTFTDAQAIFVAQCMENTPLHLPSLTLIVKIVSALVRGPLC